ncbi:hypothetical protein PAECIP111892_03591 [Paenibacillus auburnensis]|uniref:Uncharacterized protein n=1 Tax=Paenibacillus auburnensis TaxID=2905649 RepID=A0ABM9CFM6_9BACL|nr:hypothetical protein [Paenibacillus auburnensis]CAH1211547.1 hypothetical protein PAECIP111892_03591 [Paenibacillus auburnensis]
MSRLFCLIHVGGAGKLPLNPALSGKRVELKRKVPLNLALSGKRVELEGEIPLILALSEKMSGIRGKNTFEFRQVLKN